MLPGMPGTDTRPSPPSAHRGWTFLSNHAHVLIVLAREPHLRMRDVAERIGITERAVQRMIADLVDAGYVEAIRIGRRNSYRIDRRRSLRHPIEAHRSVGDLIRLGG